jgi:Protein of unknown function (DUF429)
MSHLPAIYGIDFTSAPRRAKPIVVARLDRVARDRFALVGVEAFETWDPYDAFLRHPGPWVGGFDLPFGLPRAFVETLGWPTTWAALIAHYAALDRETIRATFAAYCDARPVGSKFAHRAADGPAGSSPSMKWVNPPVAWMLHAGVPRLVEAGVAIPALHDGDPGRVALEAYPGWLARSITRASYKSDTASKQTDARRDARETIVAAIERGRHPLEIAVALTADDHNALVDDGRGDRLDAVLCAVAAAWGWQRHADGHPRYGLPADVDPLEGWIVGVPSPNATQGSSFPRKPEPDDVGVETLSAKSKATSPGSRLRENDEAGVLRRPRKKAMP